MATIIYPDGREEVTQPANGRDFSLQELQGVVGGYIEIINTRDGRLMVLHEEGKLKRLPRNDKATALARLYPGDYIAGTVLVCNKQEVT